MLRQCSTTSGCVEGMNVGQQERNLSLLAGGAVLLCGLGGSLPSRLLSAALGGSLIYRALTGYCPLYARFGISTAEDDTRANGSSSDRARASNGIEASQRPV